MVRIVAIADTHCRLEKLSPLPAGDVLIHGGDLCRRGTLEELAPTARWLNEQYFTAKIVIAGNHDWCLANELPQARGLFDESVTFLQDSGCTFFGLRFWGSPWTPAFHGWAFNHPRQGEELKRIWALIPAETDVLITHGPPFGLGDKTWDGRHAGCEILREQLPRVSPALHLFGHIHEAAGWGKVESTFWANVNCAEGTRGATVIELDDSKRIVDVEIPLG